jgi:hypothetical protein
MSGCNALEARFSRAEEKAMEALAELDRRNRRAGADLQMEAYRITDGLPRSAIGSRKATALSMNFRVPSVSAAGVGAASFARPKAWSEEGRTSTRRRTRPDSGRNRARIF